MFLFYSFLSYPILSDPILSLPILSYVVSPSYPYPILSFPVPSYPFLSYPILSFPILCNPFLLSFPIPCYSILPFPFLADPILSFRKLFRIGYYPILSYPIPFSHPTSYPFHEIVNARDCTQAVVRAGPVSGSGPSSSGPRERARSQRICPRDSARGQIRTRLSTSPCKFTWAPKRS